MNIKILIVSSNYYQEVSDNLIEGSTNYLKENNFEYEIVYSPGCFEIPFLINKYINDYVGFISLGCVIRGETYHFEMIANEVSRKIMDLSIQSNKPIGFGVIACENMEQAKARSEFNEDFTRTKKGFIQAKNKNKGLEAAVVVINNINL